MHSEKQAARSDLGVGFSSTLWNSLTVAALAAMLGGGYVVMASRTAASAFSDGAVLLAGIAVALGALYMLAFMGLSVVLREVAEAGSVAGSDITEGPRVMSAPPVVPSRGSDTDVVVVGGGIAGASAALALARAGRRVTMFERDLRYQDRIVGELLQPGGYEALRRMGLDDAVARDAIDSVEVEGYAVYAGADGSEEPSREIMLRYPMHRPRPSSWASLFGFGQTHDLQGEREVAARGLQPPSRPVRGVSFHHGACVQRLRLAALAHPNIRVVEAVVTTLDVEDGKARGVSYRRRAEPTPEAVLRHIPSAPGASKGHMPEDSAPEAAADQATPKLALAEEVEHCSAPLVVVCDGIWSTLRRKATPSAKPRRGSHSVGVMLRHPAHAPPVPRPNHGHVVLASPCPVLLYQISSTETRALVFIQGRMPSAADGSLAKYLTERVAPQLPACARPAFLRGVAAGEVKAMPNSAFSQQETSAKHMVLVGDANNMRHPLTGGGMTVALRDVELLSACLRAAPDLKETPALDAALVRFRTERVAHASTVNILANALFAVFSAPGDDPVRADLRDACYAYLASGGVFTAGPMGLLAGLTPRPWVLVTHFFMVAFYALWRILTPFPTPARLARAYRVLHVACQIIMPNIREEKAGALASWPVQSAVNFLFPAPDTPVA